MNVEENFNFVTEPAKNAGPGIGAATIWEHREAPTPEMEKM